MLTAHKHYTPPPLPTCVLVCDSKDENTFANSHNATGSIYACDTKFTRTYLSRDQRRLLNQDFSSVSYPDFREIAKPYEHALDGSGLQRMRMRRKINTPETIESRASWAEYPADVFVVVLDLLLEPKYFEPHQFHVRQMAWSIRNYYPDVPLYLVAAISEKYESSPDTFKGSVGFTQRELAAFSRQIGATECITCNAQTWARPDGQPSSLQQLYDTLFRVTTDRFSARHMQDVLDRRSALFGISTRDENRLQPENAEKASETIAAKGSEQPKPKRGGFKFFQSKPKASPAAETPSQPAVTVGGPGSGGSY